MSMVTCEYCTKPIDSDVDLDCFTNEGIACKTCRWWDTNHVEEYWLAPEDQVPQERGME